MAMTKQEFRNIVKAARMQLNVLQQQEATFGVYCPAHIKTQIKSLTSFMEIAEIIISIDENLDDNSISMIRDSARDAGITL